jgi:prepilin-type N-terminal cleavage/methylation domain-containing protein
MNFSFMGKKGFTLIEMLIVIAIIGILASIVLVGLGPVQRQARDSRRIADLRQIQTLLEICFSRSGSSNYPANIAQATLSACSGSNSRVPVDPNGSAYGYTPVASSYVLGATLEDSGNPALSNDIDAGSAGGINCADPGYCVGI